MSPERFRKALEELALSPDEFGALTESHRTTVYRWLRDGAPGIAELVLRLLIERKRLAQLLAKPPT